MTTEDFDAAVDLVPVDLWERLVDEAIVLEAGCDSLCGDVFLEINADVLRLPLGRWGVLDMGVGVASLL